MNWSPDKLPKVVLVGLDRGESKVARIMIWVVLGTFAFMTTMFFVTPDPMEAKLPTVPYWLGAFGVFFAYFFWLSRKRLRAHRTGLARILLHAPERVTSVIEERVVPRPGGVVRVRTTFDGEQEFARRPAEINRVLGFAFQPRSWVYLKIRGKWVTGKLVVPNHQAPDLLSCLFALLATKNPQCAWGKTTVAVLTQQD